MCIEGFDYVGKVAGIPIISCEDEMRVPDTALKAVVYIGVGDTPDNFHAIGTGFLVERVRLILGKFYYLVTADHVAQRFKGKKPFAIRFNDKESKSHVQSSQSQSHYSWWHHPTDKSVDAAIFPWGMRGDFATFPLTRFVTDINIKLTGIGIGDEIFIVGLFRKWSGKNRVTPIVRHGHIAMMADEPLPTTNYGSASMHLIEAFSFAGMSGSPVVVRQTSAVQLSSANDFQAKVGMVLGDMYLLGLVHGIYLTDVAMEVRNSERGQVWHSGISMVVPSTKIAEILNQPKLREYEQNIVDTMKNDKPLETSISELEQSQPTRRKSRDIDISPITRKKFFSNLEKVTRRKKPSS